MHLLKLHLPWKRSPQYCQKGYDKRTEHNLSSERVKKDKNHTVTISDRRTELFIREIFQNKTSCSNLTSDSHCATQENKII